MVCMNKLLLSAVLACTSGVLWAQDIRLEDKRVREVVLQDVVRQGIDKSPEVQAAVRLAQEAVLMRAWEQKVVASRPVTPAMKEAMYKELTALVGDQEYQVFHVFVTDEKAAKTLIARMKEVSDWSQLDPKAVMGADAKFSLNRTDWVNLSAISAEFRPVVRAMKRGDVTAEPLKTKDGWHVVGLADSRPFKMPPADRVDKEVQRLAERRVLEQHLQELLKAPAAPAKR